MADTLSSNVRIFAGTGRNPYGGGVLVRSNRFTPGAALSFGHTPWVIL